MAKITFPHMGHYSPAFAVLMSELGHEVIMPQTPTKDTLSLGTLHGPEFACLPLKICLGTYIESLERGADLIVTSGGVGPCRAGLYATVQEEILRSLGYEFEMIVLEPPRRDPPWYIVFLASLERFSAAAWQLLNIAYKSWEMIKALDVLEKELHRVRPREARVGSAEVVYKKGCRAIGAQDTVAGIREVCQAALAEMKQVPIDPTRDPIRVGIVGEIYVLLEPTANLHIEKILGELGAEVDRAIFLTGWTRENVVREGDNVTAREAACPYLCEMIGGHGQDTVGHTVMYARDGYDGVVQLAPFTCIPEIVAKGVLPSVSLDLDIPIISFFLDEQTGEAGFRTRLEAFVDLLVRRRNRRRLAG